VKSAGEPHNNSLHLRKLAGAAASRPLIEARFAGEARRQVAEGDLVMRHRKPFQPTHPSVSLGTLVLLCAAATPAMGQRAAPSWVSFSAPHLVSAVAPAGPGATGAAPTNLLDTDRGTYRTEGAIVGALLLGIAGAVLVDKFCADDGGGGDEHCSTKTFGGAVLGAGVGFTLGRLVGARFPKGP
jgi:hypothetical protein